MNENAKQRQHILEVLYQARQAQAGILQKDGWTPEADLKHAVGDTAFGLSVLVELGHVQRDGYRLRITGQGVLACEAGQHH
jgi:hypothetical protein